MATIGPPPNSAVPARRYRVWSATTPGRAYTVYAYAGRAECDCPGHLTHGSECRHMKEVLMSHAEVQIDHDEVSQALVPIVPQRVKPQLMPSANDMQAAMFIATNSGRAAGIAYPASITNPDVAMMIMLRGIMLGVDALTALRHITAINGSMEPDAQLMMGLVIAKSQERDGVPAEFRWVEVSAEKAHVQLLRRGNVVVDIEYTLEDAKRAGRYLDEEHWPSRRKVATWKKNPNTGKNVPETFAKDADGKDVWERQRPDSYWYSNTALALCYNAAKIACKLGAPDLINGIDAGVPAAMLEEGTPEADDWAVLDHPALRAGASAGQGTEVVDRAAARKRLLDEVKAAMAKESVSGAQLAALVGGPNASDVERYLDDNPRLTVHDMIVRAKLDRETGEIPDGDVDDGWDTEESDAR